MCVRCTCVYVQVHSHMCIHVKSRGVFLYSCALYMFTQHLSLNQEPIISARLAGWQAHGICLSLPLVPAQVAGVTGTEPGFYVGIRTHAQVLKFVGQTLYCRNHLLSL